MTDDPLDRLARAAERIAAAVERISRALESDRPGPDLRVHRQETTGPEAVNLGDQGRRLSIHLLNAGDQPTTIHRPTLRFDDQELLGGILGPDNQILSSAPLGAGEHQILVFDIDVAGTSLGNLNLSFCLPHAPGVFPGGTVFVADLESIGLVSGRPSWHAVRTRIEPEERDVAR